MESSFLYTANDVVIKNSIVVGFSYGHGKCVKNSIYTLVHHRIAPRKGEKDPQIPFP